MPLGAESRVRFESAQRLIAALPVGAGCEVAVTGSVTRNLADRHSDTEIICWRGRLPSDEQCRAWLEGAGVQPVSVYPPSGGVRWTTARWEGRWVEVGWSTYRTTDRLIDDLLAVRRTGGAAQMAAAALCDAIPLRTKGRLAGWQTRLAHYPDSFQERVIGINTEVWSDPHTAPVRLHLAERGALLPLGMRLTWDMQNVWAVLHAINRRWEPDYKWTTPEGLDLPIAPPNLAERLNAPFFDADPMSAIRSTYRLVRDVLDLVPDAIDVAAARKAVGGFLDAVESVPK